MSSSGTIQGTPLDLEPKPPEDLLEPKDDFLLEPKLPEDFSLLPKPLDFLLEPNPDDFSFILPTAFPSVSIASPFSAIAPITSSFSSYTIAASTPSNSLMSLKST